MPCTEGSRQLILCLVRRVKSWAITNSLLRIDGLASPPPPPFERPQNGDFAVLELGSHGNAEAWATFVVDALRTHAAVIRELQRAGASAVVFVESSSAAPVTFPVALLRVLAAGDITLEHYGRANA